jgi:hypothetical protein
MFTVQQDTTSTRYSSTDVYFWSSHSSQVKYNGPIIKSWTACLSPFWLTRNLSNYMDRQARTRNTVSVKNIERRQVKAKNCRGGWGGRSKDDKKTLAPLLHPFCSKRKRRNNLLSIADWPAGRLDTLTKNALHCTVSSIGAYAAALIHTCRVYNYICLNEWKKTYQAYATVPWGDKKSKQSKNPISLYGLLTMIVCSYSHIEPRIVPYLTRSATH